MLEILDRRIPVGARVVQLRLFAAVLGGQHVGIQVLVQRRHLIAVEEQLENTAKRKIRYHFNFCFCGHEENPTSRGRNAAKRNRSERFRRPKSYRPTWTAPDAERPPIQVLENIKNIFFPSMRCRVLTRFLSFSPTNCLNIGHTMLNKNGWRTMCTSFMRNGMASYLRKQLFLQFKWQTGHVINEKQRY